MQEITLGPITKKRLAAQAQLDSLPFTSISDRDKKTLATFYKQVIAQCHRKTKNKNLA